MINLFFNILYYVTLGLLGMFAALGATMFLINWAVDAWGQPAAHGVFIILIVIVCCLRFFSDIAGDTDYA